MEQQQGQGTRLKKLINESGQYGCIGKGVTGHRYFMHVTADNPVNEGNLHIHERDARGSYRVFTSKGWGSVWDKDYVLWLQWDGSQEEVSLGRVGGQHFALRINPDGTLNATVLKDEET